MKFTRLIVLLFVVEIVLCGCDMDVFPAQVTVTFDLNGGTVNSSSSNQIREGVEGKYFKLPEAEYITNKEYVQLDDKTNIHGKKFEGWVLKGTNTIIYNEYDSYGSFPEDDLTYIAKWGEEVVLYSETGNTTY